MNKVKRQNHSIKKRKPVNSPKNDVSIVNDRNENKNSKYVNRIVIIFLSVTISVFFIQKEVNFLKTDVHWGDEVLNMLAIKNIAATGLPVYGTYANTVTSPLHSKDALTITYWEYALELYMRAPAFIISNLINFKWEYYSSLIYLYLLFLIFIFYNLKYKDLDFETKLPSTTIAFFIILFSISKFASSQFHYVRYYPFTIMIVPLIHILSNMVFISSKSNLWKKSLLILLLSSIPGLFHLVNFSYMFFWFLFLICFLLFSFIKNQNNKSSLKKIIFANYHYLFSGIALILLLAAFVDFLMHFLKNRLFFSSENIQVIPEFFSFYFNKNFIVYDILFITLIIISIIKFKQFNKIEASLYRTSLGFLLFCLIGFSIIGGKGIISNPYSYMMFMFPVILIIISLMLSLLFKIILRSIPEFFLKEPIIFFIIVVIFTLINYNKLQENENRSDGTKQELEQLIHINNTYKDLIFVTSKNTHYFFNYFPDNKAYLLRNYPEKLKINEITDDFYLSNSGFTKNIGGEIYIGKTNAFCRMLNDNIDKLIYFYRIIPNYLSEEFLEKIKNLDVGNPVSAKYLSYFICSKDLNERIKQASILSKENGLLENEYVAIGAFLFNQSLFDDCKRACLQALNLNPGNTHALVNLGVCYIRAGNWTEAIKVNEKALSIDPKLDVAQKNLLYAEENIRLQKNQKSYPNNKNNK